MYACKLYIYINSRNASFSDVLLSLHQWILYYIQKTFLPTHDAINFTNYKLRGFLPGTIGSPKDDQILQERGRIKNILIHKFCEFNVGFAKKFCEILRNFFHTSPLQNVIDVSAWASCMVPAIKWVRLLEVDSFFVILRTTLSWTYF